MISDGLCLCAVNFVDSTGIGIPPRAQDLTRQMTNRTQPFLLNLRTKLARLEDEVKNLNQYVDTVVRTPEEYRMEWSVIVTAGAGVRNIYSGIEDILKSIAEEIDGYAPKGEGWQQGLLNQLAVASSVRPPLLDTGRFQALTELKAFRCVVKHNYGIALNIGRVNKNLALLQQTYPLFVGALSSLESHLNGDDTPDRDISRADTPRPGKA